MRPTSSEPVDIHVRPSRPSPLQFNLINQMEGFHVIIFLVLVLAVTISTDSVYEVPTYDNQLSNKKHEQLANAADNSVITTSSQSVDNESPTDGTNSPNYEQSNGQQEGSPEQQYDEILTTTKAPDERVSNTCLDQNYCLNGGVCALNEHNQMYCICPDGFYGTRCETRDVCKTLIVDSLTGDQICAKINQRCLRNDKFIRCSCGAGEFFVFGRQAGPTASGNQNGKYGASGIGSNAKFTYASTTKRETSQVDVSYVAECRRADKCLGVRCRQMSEVCDQGECVCNQKAGYVRDPSDKLCKLLDPCRLARPDGQPVCGEAACVATYDRDLIRCICPVGFTAIQTGGGPSSTKCVPVMKTICEVPLLNKCQHICALDDSLLSSGGRGYRCSCLPGYKQGQTNGVDDHLCFFDENATEARESRSEQPAAAATGDLVSIYEPERMWIPTNPLARHELDNTPNNSVTRVRRKLVRATTWPHGQEEAANSAGLVTESPISRLSAQERCNMFCEENKICVLEPGASSSYRCHCDRQGFVSVGDRCLDWCSAADFGYRVRGLLESVCLSNACRIRTQRATNESLDRFSESSRRPDFECDCSTSEFLRQDPSNGLCQVDFQAVLATCLPGGRGYADCVENKHAYCSVLHQNGWQFLKSLRLDRGNNMFRFQGSSGSSNGGPNPSANGQRSNDRKRHTAHSASGSQLQPYACVCSPEKKLLVDKPRGKARCVDECELLNNECERFNRMCRSATMPPETDYRQKNLAQWDWDGVRMNLKRTGCECLPGFNVGPTELIDFTLDDNFPPIAPGDQTSPVGQPTGQLIDGLAAPAFLMGSQDVAGLGHESAANRRHARYMNINSRCLLDHDVVQLQATFKAPADFDPTWLPIRNAFNPSESINPKGPDQGTNKIRDTDNCCEQNPKTATNARGQGKSDPIGTVPNPLSGASSAGDPLAMPEFMFFDPSDLHQHVVLVGQCEQFSSGFNVETYQECLKYRYWIVTKLKRHFIDWRAMIADHLKPTFDLMDGSIRLHINHCEASIRHIESFRPKTISGQATYVAGPSKRDEPADSSPTKVIVDPTDQAALIDADIHCELTLHSASQATGAQNPRNVLLEKQLPRFIFSHLGGSGGGPEGSELASMQPEEPMPSPESTGEPGPTWDPLAYYLMAPKVLVSRSTVDQLAEHRKLFNPCQSSYSYCDKQTKCEMVDTVNFTCTCEYGYTPIGSRDITYMDSRKEVCEDINECLFDACKELAGVAKCINEIGDYRCECNRHYTGDNKRYCTHVCNTIPCKHGKCRLLGDHHAFCECDEGYKEADCSVQDQSAALRKANLIICGSIFTSVLLLAITLAYSLNSQLRKTKKKLKRLEAVAEASNLYEFTAHQQAFRHRLSKTTT